MNHLLKGAVIAIAASACGGGTATFQGEKVYQRFPLDDGLLRSWSFESDDTSLSYRMAATQLPDPVALDEGRTLVHTIEFRAKCFNTTGFCEDGDEDNVGDRDGEVLMVWDVSSDSLDGVRFHRVVVGEDEIVYDPPVVLADSTMLLASSVETKTDGGTFTSTYEGLTGCPAPKYWTSDPPDCAEFTLEAEGTTSPITGSIYATVTVAFVAFTLDSDGGSTWSLKGFTSEDL